MNRVNLPIHPFILCLRATAEAAARAEDFFTWVTINCFNTKERERKNSWVYFVSCFHDGALVWNVHHGLIFFISSFHLIIQTTRQGEGENAQDMNARVLSTATHWHPHKQYNVTWEWLSLFVIYFHTQTHVEGRVTLFKVIIALLHVARRENEQDHSTSWASENRYKRRQKERGRKMTSYIASHHITSYHITSTQVNVL